MFSADNDGILGQAYPLTACRQDRTFRTGVSDWPTDRFRNDEAGAAEYLMQVCYIIMRKKANMLYEALRKSIFHRTM